MLTERKKDKRQDERGIIVFNVASCALFFLSEMKEMVSRPAQAQHTTKLPPPYYDAGNGAAKMQLLRNPAAIALLFSVFITLQVVHHDSYIIHVIL